MMLTLTNFQSELGRLGIKIRLANGKATLIGNTTNLPPEKLVWLRENKAAIIAMLEAASDPVQCYVCPETGAEAYSRWPLDSRYWRKTGNR